MLIPLRNYSHYSICESNIKIEDLVEFAFQKKLPAIALTDYNLLSGALEFSIKCKKKGIQPIIGLDVNYVSSMTHSSRITIVSKNELGFKNLNILSTKINTENNFILSAKNINDFSQGNILILGGLYSIFEKVSLSDKNLKRLYEEIKILKKIFDNDIFFEFDIKLDNSLINEISNNLDVSSFQSSFSFYKSSDDFSAMRILHCVKNGEYLQNTSYNIDNNYSLDRVNNIYDQNLITNSQLIANKVNFIIEEKPISLPNFSSDPNADENREIIKQSRSGLDLRLKKNF